MDIVITTSSQDAVGTDEESQMKACTLVQFRASAFLHGSAVT